MRTHTWIKTSLAAVFAVVGLAACIDEPAPEESTSTVTEEVSHPITYTTYYAESAHVTVVGRCTSSICPQWPKGTFCTGHKTLYFTGDFDTCE